MSIKLIALDLDGTLLTSQKTISQRTYDALQQAANMGIYIVPCTGRFYACMPEAVKALPFVKYSININGAVIFETETMQSVFDSGMDVETVCKIYDYFDTLDVAYDTYLDNWGFMPRKHFETIDKYIKNPFYVSLVHDFRTPVDDIRSCIRQKNMPVQKVQYFTPDAALLLKGYYHLKEEFPDLQITTSGSIDVEINSHDATKANGIITLAKMLNIDISETMAFGDGGNDISMLKAVGFGISMGNGKEAVQEAADYVTLSNDEDGVAAALEKFVLKK